MFKPVWNHVVAFAIIIFIYVGWASVGHGCVGKYTYFFLDHEKIGWEYYWASVAGLIFLSELCRFLLCLCKLGLTNDFSLCFRIFCHWRS